MKHEADLALAGAVVSGDPDALARLRDSYLSRVPSHVRHLDPSAQFAAEVEQRLMIHLVVAEAPRRPRLAAYDGRGALGAFIRVAAVRIALDLLRERRPAASIDEAMEAWRPGVDPELDYLKARYRPAFVDAFAAALAALTAKERTLLRLAYCDGLTLAELGALERVHLSTVSRRLDALRRRLTEETRRGIAARLNVGDHEISTLVRMVGSQLDVSLRGLLGAETAAAGSAEDPGDPSASG
jgi:RNA polymerase sigma-70 factor (ECF subfamily)